MKEKIRRAVKKLLLSDSANKVLDPLNLDSTAYKYWIVERIEEKLKTLSPKEAVKLAMDIDNEIYHVGRRASLRYGNGIHTKHKHINFHEFFQKNIKPGENILDVGSSTGDLASDLAKYAAPGKVIGIEIEKDRVKEASKRYKNITNLSFVFGDATDKQALPSFKVDTITLSNVLEHIDKRVDFLKQLIRIYKPKKVLIRVPTFERDWRVPLKKEVEVDYRLDVTHYIEFTKDEFIKEMKEAGLDLIDLDISWGEFRAVLKPKK